MNRTVLVLIGIFCAVISAAGIMHWYNNPVNHVIIGLSTSQMEKYYEEAFNKAYDCFGEMNFPNSHVYGAPTTEEFEHLRLHYRMESRIFRSGDLDALDFLRRKIINSKDDGVEQCCALKILKEINTQQSWQLLASFIRHPDENINGYAKECLLEYKKEELRVLPEYPGLKLYNNQKEK